MYCAAISNQMVVGKDKGKHLTQGRKWILLDELKVCRNLQRGKEIHVEVMESGNDSCIYLATALVKMYAKCGSMADAHRVFDRMKHPDVVSWTALILGYADNGEGIIALDLFAMMISQGCAPDSLTFIAALKSCSSLVVKDNGLKRGREIHSQIGCHLNMKVENTLIYMYSKCGSMIDARQVFDSMKYINVVTWNTLILGYADNGAGATALDLFARMKSRGCAPDSLTFLAAIKACTSLAPDGSRRAECLDLGKRIHSQIGWHMNIKIQNTLINMYAKCGSMADARKTFGASKHRDVVSWNALILGYADNGEGSISLDLFASMKAQGYPPNVFTFVAALKACTSLAVDQIGFKRAECLERGRQIHSQIGTHADVYVQSILITMYATCGSMADALQVFKSMKHPDVVSWTALILGYADNGEGIIALDWFARMISQGCAPDSFTFVAALKACTSLALDTNGTGREECLERGQYIHSQLGCHSDIKLDNTLIDMYTKCGSMIYARQVFDDMKVQDVVSWNTLILGYVDRGEGIIALNLFSRMKSQGCSPDLFTYIAALRACGLAGALECGRQIHAEMETGIEPDVLLVTCLVDFYAKCGDLEAAQKVFDSYPRRRDLKTWTALLAGYAGLGDSETVFGLVEAMQDQGFRPDGVTFLCLLSCCCHAGLVDKGNACLQEMATKYGTTPIVEHYTCMVDNLSRSNKLDDAIAVMQRMPCWPNAVTWMTILAACLKWKNVEIGRLAFESVLSLDDTKLACYVLMARIYGCRGLWKEQEMVLSMRKGTKVREKLI